MLERLTRGWGIQFSPQPPGEMRLQLFETDGWLRLILDGLQEQAAASLGDQSESLIIGVEMAMLYSEMSEAITVTQVQNPRAGPSHCASGVVSTLLCFST